MTKHFKYLKYLIKHKYYVFLAGIRLKVPLFQLIIHDWSKFLPSEWIPYCNYFYGVHESRESFPKYIYVSDKITKEYWQKRFNVSWLKHIHRSPHHWQYWILREDSGAVKLLDIPDKFILEMVADWAGAGRAIKAKWEVKEWYYKNKDKILINDDVREKVEELIEENF